MGAYYYLAAQLPYLVYGQNIPMSSDDFKALARKSMSSGEGALLDQCTLESDPEAGAAYPGNPKRTGSEFINRWNDWERTLRLNLAKGRSLKLKREGGVSFTPPDTPADAAGAAKTAMNMESPLEAELYLDKARWTAIENFQGLNNFSENALYAYLLKLLLMERRAAFNTEEGFTEYKRLYADILGVKSYGETK